MSTKNIDNGMSSLAIVDDVEASASSTPNGSSEAESIDRRKSDQQASEQSSIPNVSSTRTLHGEGDLEPVDFFQDEGAQGLKNLYPERPQYDGVSHWKVQPTLETFHRHIDSCFDISNMTTIKAFATILYGPAHEWFANYKIKAGDSMLWGTLQTEFERRFDFDKGSAWFFLHNPKQEHGQSVGDYYKDQRYARTFWPTAEIPNETKRWLRGIRDPVAYRVFGKNAAHETMDQIETRMHALSLHPYMKKVLSRPFDPYKIRKKVPQIYDDDID